VQLLFKLKADGKINNKIAPLSVADQFGADLNAAAGKAFKERGRAFLSTVAGALPRPKSFGTARVLIACKGRLSPVDEGDWKTCAPLGSSGRRVFCGCRCLMSEEEDPYGDAEARA
jgi:hypothetical protein